MPWRGVTVSEQRQRFLEDHKLNYYSVTELAGRFWSFPCIASLPLAQQASSSLMLGPDNPGRSPACKAIGRFASG